MKIRMRTTAAGPQGAYNAGQVYEIPADLAKAFIAAGAAEAVKADQPQPVEMAISPAPLSAEQALSPRGKAKK